MSTLTATAIFTASSHITITGRHLLITVPYHARYTVNADCTGRSIYRVFGAEFDLFIAPDGDKFMWILTEPAESEGVSGLEERVTLLRIGV